MSDGTKLMSAAMIAGSRFRLNDGEALKVGAGADVGVSGAAANNSDAKTRVVPCARKKAQSTSVARMIALESRCCRGVATKGY